MLRDTTAFGASLLTTRLSLPGGHPLDPHGLLGASLLAGLLPPASIEVPAHATS